MNVFQPVAETRSGWVGWQQECADVDFDRTSFTDGINALVCFSLDVDPLHIRAEKSGEIGLNGILVRADLGALADHCAVEISDSKPSGSDSAGRFSEKCS